MPKNIKDLLPIKQDANSDVLSSVLERLNDLKSMLLSLTIKDQLSQVSEIIAKLNKKPVAKDLPGQPEMSHEEALDNLEDVATSKKDDTGSRLFLLHRPTEDYEYEKCIGDGAYETSEDTEWVADYEKSEDKRDRDNPVVACWVPESSVREIPHPHANTGTWGELGQNPHKKRYTAVVKPGKYDLYQELKS